MYFDPVNGFMSFMGKRVQRFHEIERGEINFAFTLVQNRFSFWQHFHERLFWRRNLL